MLIFGAIVVVSPLYGMANARRRPVPAPVVPSVKLTAYILLAQSIAISLVIHLVIVLFSVQLDLASLDIDPELTVYVCIRPSLAPFAL